MDLEHFLTELRPDGPWLLSAINESGTIETALHKTLKTARAWVDFKSAEEFNLYYHVNTAAKGHDKRAKKSDIDTVEFLHVDVDPFPREDLKADILDGQPEAIEEMKQHNEDERARILLELTTLRPDMVPEPTFIVDSGGGYQALWRLKEPKAIRGSAEAIAEVELRNKQLETLFKADHCHNIDRLLRLPGTMNIPNKRKREKCREIVEATLHSHNAVSYDLEEFVTAPKPPTLEKAVDVSITGSVEKVQSVEEMDQWLKTLGPARMDAVKVIMVDGEGDWHKHEKDMSASGWVFHFCCECVRAGVPDEKIYAILMDPDWAISKHVLSQPNKDRAAKRNIGRAHLFSIDPELDQMNQIHAALADLGGKFRVMRMHDPDAKMRTDEDGDDFKRESFTLHTKTDFLSWYMNRFVEYEANGKTKRKQLGQWWLEHPNRRQYNRVVFQPDEDTPEDTLNMWNGWQANDRPGKCDLFLAHIHDNVCHIDPEFYSDPAAAKAHQEQMYEYFLDWCANMVQNPAQPGHTALVLSGEKGVGKGFVVTRLGELVGRHFLQITNSAHLVGNFNAHLAETLLLFADEAFYANDKKHDGVLKGLVTEPTIPIERKGIDVEQIPNYLHIIMATNLDHAVQVSSDERRYVMFDVGNEHRQDHAYFRAIAQEWCKGGRDAFFSLLRHRDISKFSAGATPPWTPALKRNYLMSLDSVYAWWLSKLKQQYIVDTDADWPKEVPVKQMLADYGSWCKANNERYPAGEEEFGARIKKLCAYKGRHRTRKTVQVTNVDGNTEALQRYFYRFGTIEECRALWEDLFVPIPWDDADAEDS